MSQYRKNSIALLFALGSTPLSAAGTKWPASFGGTVVSGLPMIMVDEDRASPKLALVTKLPAGRETPLLDRLANVSSSKSVRRYRSYETDLAGGVIGVEALRVGGGQSDRFAIKGEPATRRSWAVGVRSGWALGTDDRLSVGVARGADRGSPRGLVVTYPHDVTSTALIGVNWAHGEQWQMDVDWRRVGGKVHGAQDRMVQLSNGAALHQTGVAMSVAFLPAGRGDPCRTSIGFEARRASVAADDLAQINPDQRQVTQGALVLKTHF